MKLFAYAEQHPSQVLAVSDEGLTLHYREVFETAEALSKTLGDRRLLFLLCENRPGTLLGYLGCLRVGVVPLLLDAHIDPQLLRTLGETYHPAGYYLPRGHLDRLKEVLPQTAPVLEVGESVLLPTGEEGPPLHPDLVLLLTTSGSTGSPKLVRLTGTNLDANGASIAEYLDLGPKERPITSLPMSYSYGMSIVNSHLLVGAPLLLTQYSIMEKAFWERVTGEEATSLAGVPYTYQMLHRLGLTQMDLPSLTTLTQAGGKLPLELHQSFARWAERTGRRFFVMYGQTEAGPRMGYLPPALAVEKCGAMGIPIPGGRFRLEQEDGGEITAPDTVGELVYQGENVSMGYAQCADDLAKGDIWKGELHTGDMARRDKDGVYFITGRKKRFVKLYGNRVNLDEVEQLLLGRFPETGFACVGRDDCLTVYTNSRAADLPPAILEYLSSRTHLSQRAFRVRILDQIPKNEAGKTCYAELES